MVRGKSIRQPKGLLDSDSKASKTTDDNEGHIENDDSGAPTCRNWKDMATNMQASQAKRRHHEANKAGIPKRSIENEGNTTINGLR